MLALPSCRPICIGDYACPTDKSNRKSVRKDLVYCLL